MSLYGSYEEFYFHNPDLKGTRKGGNTRSKTAKRFCGKFAPEDPDQEFIVDMDSHRRGGVAGGRKRKAQVEVLGLRDEETGRFLPLEGES